MQHSLRILALIATTWLTASPAHAGEVEEVVPTLQAIQALCDDGNFEEAAARATRLVSAHPDALDAHLALQDAQLALGEETALLRRYRQRSRSPNATSDDHFLVARLLSGNDAVAEFRAALKLRPDHFWALCGLGTELSAMGKTKAALHALSKAENVNPASGVPPNLRGRVEESRGRLDDAEALYRAAIARQPELIIAHINLGVLLTGRGKHQAALRVLDAAVKRSPSTTGVYLARGMTRMSAGKNDAAVRDFEDARDLDASLVSLTLLANAYLSMERLDEAGAALDQAYGIAPRHAPTHVMRAYLYLADNRINMALSSAKLATELDPKLAEARHLLALCLERTGDLKKAESAYKRAAKLDTSDPTQIRALALFYEARGRWKDAIREYNKVVKLTDGAPDAWLDLALAQWGLAKYDKAARSLESLLEVDETRRDAWLNLGILCQTQLRKRRKAISAFREYLDLGGKDARVAGWLAELER